jgi:hypothetical protein
MPDEIAVKPKSESESAPAIAAQEKQNTNPVLSQLINLCAMGLAASFFLPWAQIFGRNISGFDLQKMGNGQQLLWAIPVFCVITIIACLTKSGRQLAGISTGLLPFLVGIYWYSKFGNDMFQILSFGAYLSLIFGLGLIILSANPQ